MRRRTIAWLLALSYFLGLPMTVWADDLEDITARITVDIVSPPPGLALFDEVEIEAVVRPESVVERVEIYLDGRVVGSLREPPYRLRIDVGPENRERRIEILARGRDGSAGWAQRLAPRLRIDEELDLGLRQIYVTVTDRRGQRVLELGRDDFAIHDEGRPQTLVTFARGGIPFTAVLLLDGSLSMQGSRLEAALDGVRRFVSGMEELDEARILVHSDRLLARTDWSSGPGIVTDVLATTEARGGSSILDYLYFALAQLEKRQGRRVVVFLSDGWDLESVLSADQLWQVARLSQALIYWVRLAGDQPATGGRLKASPEDTYGPVRIVPYSSWRDQDDARKTYKQLERIVEESGGRIVTVSSHDLGPAFEDILAELREQYALGYYPDPRRRDGSWRDVAVELGQRGLKVSTRLGYVDR